MENEPKRFQICKDFRVHVSAVALLVLIGLEVGYVIGFEMHSPQVDSQAQIASQELTEPYTVEVVSIYDGDTFFADIDAFPNVIGERIGIRIKNIDTAELRGTEGEEKEIAREAKVFAVEKLRSARKVQLVNIERDPKYFRIMADVLVDGENLGEKLLENGLALPYNGGVKPDWQAFLDTVE